MGPSHGESMEQRPANHEHKNEGISSMRSQHPALRQRVMDSLFAPIAQTQHIQHALPEKDTRHRMAEPCHEQGRSCQSQHPKNVCSPLSDTLMLAWACHTNAGWSHPKRHPVWRKHIKY